MIGAIAGSVHAASASGTVLVSETIGTGNGMYVAINPTITTSTVTMCIHRLE
jgi:hypothetical protein